MGIMTININFKYTEDANGKDTDIHSAQLREDLLYLYRKELPNVVLFDIQKGKDITDDYLVWNGWRFSSDSITNTYTHQKNYQWMIQELEKTAFYEELINKYRAVDYTIGCHIIYPKNNNKNNPKSYSINFILFWVLKIHKNKLHLPQQKNTFMDFTYLVEILI